jgi:transcriptional regulator with XRE-family HTH domain
MAFLTPPLACGSLVCIIRRLASMVEEALAERFGKLVRRLREERGFSQEGFAFRVGLHRTYVGDIERGEKNVTLVTANKLVRGLDLTLADLLLEMEQRSDDPEEG